MSRLAMITFLTGPDAVDPGFGVPSVPGYGGGRPDNSLPWHGHPDNSLPRPPGSIGTLPVFPFDPTVPVDPGYGQGVVRPDRPDNSLPGMPGRPDNSLPSAPVRPSQPIQLHPGLRLVVKWVACYGFVAVPDNSLPETAEPK